MSDRSLARSILGGAAVVVLSGVAAFFGAGLAQREPAPVVAQWPSSAAGDVAIEALERRLVYLERRVDTLESRPVASSESAPSTAQPVPVPVPGSAVKIDVPPPTAAPAVPNDPLKTMEDARRSMMRTWVVSRMKLLADTSNEGSANRLAQAVGDSTQLIRTFGLRGDDVLDRVRDVYNEEWQTGSREVGPLVRDGLARADVATVRERLRGLWAESDRKLRPLFDDEGWKSYEGKSAASRKSFDDVLVEFETARLSGR